MESLRSARRRHAGMLTAVRSTVFSGVGVSELIEELHGRLAVGIHRWLEVKLSIRLLL